MVGTRIFIILKVVGFKMPTTHLGHPQNSSLAALLMIHTLEVGPARLSHCLPCDNRVVSALELATNKTAGEYWLIMLQSA